MEVFIFFYIVFSLIVGYIADTREGKFFPAFLSSLILTPLLALILTLLMKRKIPAKQNMKSITTQSNGEATSGSSSTTDTSNSPSEDNGFNKITEYKPKYIKYAITVAVLLLLTFPFHYIPFHLKVCPKETLTLKNTFIFQSDIDDLIERYNYSNPFERIDMMKEPLFKMLKELGLIYSVDQPVNTSSTSESQSNTSTQNSTENNSTEEYLPEDKKIIEKIKEKSKRDFPDDYYTQKMIFDQAVEAYFYMKSVSDLKIKRKMEKDYPLDFFTQKMVYNQEIDAKEQMK